tara:strand:- start:5373 stop:5645 length:273 start_codon:yes stop_codon:yes gene_type:complete
LLRLAIFACKAGNSQRSLQYYETALKLPFIPSKLQIVEARKISQIKNSNFATVEQYLEHLRLKEEVHIHLFMCKLMFELGNVNDAKGTLQ